MQIEDLKFSLQIIPQNQAATTASVHHDQTTSLTAVLNRLFCGRASHDPD
jgi:hypothetical protein